MCSDWIAERGRCWGDVKGNKRRTVGRCLREFLMFSASWIFPSKNDGKSGTFPGRTKNGRKGWWYSSPLIHAVWIMRDKVSSQFVNSDNTVLYKSNFCPVKSDNCNQSGIQNPSIWGAYCKIPRHSFWDMATLTCFFWQPWKIEFRFQGFWP